jgi:antitoxin component YwqK of YwqJK toxin-antitoxin module
MQGNFTHGKREGIWITFSPNGDTLIKASYQNDKLNGQYTVYNENDEVANLMMYKDDRLVSK